MDPPYFAQVVSGPTRILAAIEAFLAAFARASLILYPIGKVHSARGRHLRAALGRDREHNDPFNNRRLRDGWMHLDEDIGLLAADGRVVPTSVVSTGADRWYSEALRGAVRIVDARDVAVALPRRGVWSLRPYFHECTSLLQDISATLTNPYRWERVGDVQGLAVGWSGKSETWMLKSLTRGCTVTVTARSYNEAVAAFQAAVASWRQATGTL